MAYDRFIYWDKERPVEGQLRAILEDYLGDSAVVEASNPKRMLATLKGKPSPALRRITKTRPSDHEERWFEVFIGDDNIDVITRTADEFTNAVAEGYADIVARLYNVDRGAKGSSK